MHPSAKNALISCEAVEFAECVVRELLPLFRALQCLVRLLCLTGVSFEPADIQGKLDAVLLA